MPNKQTVEPLGWELKRLSHTVCFHIKLKFLFNYLVFSMISTGGVGGVALYFLQSIRQAHSDCDVPPAARAGPQGEGCARGSSILCHGLSCDALERLL